MLTIVAQRFSCKLKSAPCMGNGRHWNALWWHVGLMVDLASQGDTPSRLWHQSVSHWIFFSVFILQSGTEVFLFGMSINQSIRIFCSWLPCETQFILFVLVRINKFMQGWWYQKAPFSTYRGASPWMELSDKVSVCHIRWMWFKHRSINQNACICME